MDTITASHKRATPSTGRICSACGKDLGRGGLRLGGIRYNVHATKCTKKRKQRGNRVNGWSGSNGMGQFYKKPKNPEILVPYRLRSNGILGNSGY